jgi:hypothetical protein
MDAGPKLREVLERHRADLGMPADGGLSDRWVVRRLGPVPLPFVNTSARRRALVLRDVNHLVAGVGAGNVGEAEISTWDLASGGRQKHLAAWTLDLAGMLLGMVGPIHVMRAFAAGRTMSNAYTFDVDEVLDLELWELRRILTRPAKRGVSSMLRSVALFIGYLVLAVPIGGLFLLMVVLSLPIWMVTKDESQSPG